MCEATPCPPEAPTPPALIIKFQGLCAFLRNNPDPTNANEVITAMLAGEKAGETPQLCRHTPVLVFKARDFFGDTGKATHITGLDPNATVGSGQALPALGVWPLTGRDLYIVGAPRHKLKISTPFNTADLHTLTGRGEASGACIAPTPPDVVGARFFLTSGTLADSTLIGSSSSNDQWKFLDEHTATNPTEGIPEPFSQEVIYKYYNPVPGAEVLTIASRPFGDILGPSETLTLSLNYPPVVLGVCCLCAIYKVTQTEMDSERDFLAYYHLLANSPKSRVIPFRIKRPDARITASACPPASTYYKEIYP